jgi:chorismate mutase
MTTRGIRGATTIESDTPEQVLAATRELLEAIVSSNPDLTTDAMASAFFTVTDDIAAAFPARAARELGWDQVPMMCCREIPVTGSLRLCIRLLIHWNTDKPQSGVKHAYLREAAGLRPDLMDQPKERSK